MRKSLHHHYFSMIILFKLKVSLISLIMLIIILACVTQEKQTSKVDYVNPFIGTGGYGHTFPGAIVPFGMVQLSPDTHNDGWNWCSGYHYSDSSIMGFSHTHLSGTGGQDLLDILFMPFTGDVQLIPGPPDNPDKGYRSRFNHSHEKARPGYYSVYLQDHRVNAELTATTRAGFHRYTFDSGTDQKVIIDLRHGPAREQIIESSFQIVNDSLVLGYKRSSGWAKDQYIYFAAIFSKPFETVQLFEDYKLQKETIVHGENIQAVLNFKPDENPLLAKVGISAVSTANALENLITEIAGWDFDGVAEEAAQRWEKELSKIEVEGGTFDDRVKFYTALYHSYIHPSLFTDVNGEYRGVDHKVHRAENFTNYTIFSLWDTFRALHPLLTITQEDKVPDMVNSMLQNFDQKGKLPVWTLHGNETDAMIGYHAVPVIADAILKGIKGFDYNRAFDYMKRTAMRDDYGLYYYRKYGYIPHETEDQSVSKTLEYAFDDYAIAMVAEKLEAWDDHHYFMGRAMNYRNLFDTVTLFMRARGLDGSWVQPFNPLFASHTGSHYTEGNAWQYTWHVMQDIPGLIECFGGENIFTERLDSLFTMGSSLYNIDVLDITGLIGQYAHGNEPVHHVAHLYNFTGKPWKTQQLVAQIRDSLYLNTPDGLCGNDDSGQMSAWFVFNAMGLYPVNPVGGNYSITTPLFSKVTIHNQNGSRFVIRVKGDPKKQKYIQSLKLNKKRHEDLLLKHGDIKNGGELIIRVTDRPNNSGSPSIVKLPYKPQQITGNENGLKLLIDGNQSLAWNNRNLNFHLNADNIAGTVPEDVEIYVKYYDINGRSDTLYLENNRVIPASLIANLPNSFYIETNPSNNRINQRATQHLIRKNTFTAHDMNFLWKTIVIDSETQSYLGNISDGSYAVIADLDLNNIGSVSMTYASLYNPTHLEIRSGAPDGKIIGKHLLPVTQGWHNWKTVTIPILHTSDRNSLFFVFKADEQTGYLVNLLEVSFARNTE